MRVVAVDEPVNLDQKDRVVVELDLDDGALFGVGAGFDELLAGVCHCLREGKRLDFIADVEAEWEIQNIVTFVCRLGIAWMFLDVVGVSRFFVFS